MLNSPQNSPQPDASLITSSVQAEKPSEPSALSGNSPEVNRVKEIFRDIFLNRLGEGKEFLHTPEILEARSQILHKLGEAIATEYGMKFSPRLPYEESHAHVKGSTLIYVSSHGSDGSWIKTKENPGSAVSQVLDYEIQVKRQGQSEKVFRLKNLEVEQLLSGDKSVLTPLSERLRGMSLQEVYAFYKQNSQRQSSLYDEKGNLRPEDQRADGSSSNEHWRVLTSALENMRVSADLLGNSVHKVIELGIAADLGIVRKALLARLDHAQSNIRMESTWQYLKTLPLYALVRFSVRNGDQENLRKISKSICRIADYHRQHAAIDILESLSTQSSSGAQAAESHAVKSKS